MKSFDWDLVIGVTGFVVGLVGIGYAAGTRSKMNQISEKLDKSLDDIVRDSRIDIPNGLIERAVERSVEAKTRIAIDNTVSRAMDKADSIIRSSVSTAIKNQYGELKNRVLGEMTKRVSNINEERLRDDIYNAAKEKAVEKFEANLDDILEKFNNDLENVGKIYKSIANVMTKNEGKEMTFRIG